MERLDRFSKQYNSVVRYMLETRRNDSRDRAPLDLSWLEGRREKLNSNMLALPRYCMDNGSRCHSCEGKSRSYCRKPVEIDMETTLDYLKELRRLQRGTYIRSDCVLNYYNHLYGISGWKWK